MATNPSNQSAAKWRKARASVPRGYCVEALIEVDTVQLRDSKGPQDTQLRFGRRSWTEFLEGLYH
jgi:hypothetical protein